MAGHPPEIEILAGKAGIHLRVLHGSPEAVGPSEKFRHVIRDLCEAGFDIQRRVPRPPARPVEAVEFPWFRVGKARIDEAGMRDAVDQFAGVEGARSAMLGLKPGAGCPLDFRERLEIVLANQRPEHGLAVPGAGHKSDGPRKCLADDRQAGEGVLRARHAPRRRIGGPRS